MLAAITVKARMLGTRIREEREDDATHRFYKNQDLYTDMGKGNRESVRNWRRLSARSSSVQSDSVLRQFAGRRDQRQTVSVHVSYQLPPSVSLAGI